jgi:transcriptional regulator with XRE-family HTH domain
MGKAGQALRQVLEGYAISQNKLAVAMGIERTHVHRWVQEKADPGGDAIANITEALQQLNPEAAREFVQFYLGEILGVGQASRSLRQVLETYEISQNKLAVTMGISRANVGRWFHGLDPSAENIAEITKALQQINPDAAREFVQLYLGNLLDNPEKLEDE